MCGIYYRSGDEVEIVFPAEETSAGLLAEEGHLDILYEDDAIIIVDKATRTKHNTFT